MATRRPLVQANGQAQQLPVGDAVAGIPAKLPAYTAGGLLLSVPLTAAYAAPVALAGGGSLNVQVVLNG